MVQGTEILPHWALSLSCRSKKAEVNCEHTGQQSLSKMRDRDAGRQAERQTDRQTVTEIKETGAEAESDIPGRQDRTKTN